MVVHYDAQELLEAYRRKINAADLTQGMRKEFLAHLEEGLTGYTYLEE